MTGLKERFGRPLRLGLIGGGPDAWIGRMHRGAAEMDGWWRAVAGVFSSDAARSRAAGAAMGFDPLATRGTAPFEGCDSMLELAEQAGIGTRDPRQIEVIGARVADVRMAFR